MQKKKPGDPLRIRAADYNKMLDAAKKVDSLHLGGGVPASIWGQTSCVVQGQNVSSEAIEPGEAVAIGDTPLSMANDSAGIMDMHTLKVRPRPGIDRIIGIAAGGIKAGAVGPVVVSGVAYAKIFLADSSEQISFAIPVGDKYLQAASGGPVRVLAYAGDVNAQRPKLVDAIVCVGQHAYFAPMVVTGPGDFRISDAIGGNAGDPEPILVKDVFGVLGGRPSNCRFMAYRHSPRREETNMTEAKADSEWWPVAAEGVKWWGTAVAGSGNLPWGQIPLTAVQRFGPGEAVVEDDPTWAWCASASLPTPGTPLLLLRKQTGTIGAQGEWFCVSVGGSGETSTLIRANDKPEGGNSSASRTFFGRRCYPDGGFAGSEDLECITPRLLNHDSAIFEGTVVQAKLLPGGQWLVVGGGWYDDPIGTIKMQNANGVLKPGWREITNAQGRVLLGHITPGSTGGSDSFTVEHDGGFYAPARHDIDLHKHEGYFMKLKTDENASEFEYILDAQGATEHSVRDNSGLEHPVLNFSQITHLPTQWLPRWFGVRLIERFE